MAMSVLVHSGLPIKENVGVVIGTGASPHALVARDRAIGVQQQASRQVAATVAEASRRERSAARPGQAP